MAAKNGDFDRLPPELHNMIIGYLDERSSIFLAATNHYFHSTADLTKEQRISFLLSLEKLPKNRGKPACTICFQIKPLVEFLDDSQSRGVKLNANTKFCIDCGMNSGVYAPENMTEVFTSSDYRKWRCNCCPLELEQPYCENCRKCMFCKREGRCRRCYFCNTLGLCDENDADQCDDFGPWHEFNELEEDLELEEELEWEWKHSLTHSEIDIEAEMEKQETLLALNWQTCNMSYQRQGLIPVGNYRARIRRCRSTRTKEHSKVAPTTRVSKYYTRIDEVVRRGRRSV